MRARPDCVQVLWQLYRRSDQPAWHRAEHLLSEAFCRRYCAVSTPRPRHNCAEAD